MNKIANSLRAPVASGYSSEPRPGEIGELVAVAIPTWNQEQQHVVGKTGDRRHLRVGRSFNRFTQVVNDEAIGECDQVCRNLDPRNAIAEMIEVGAHRKRGIGV